jgi:hypothetical protein
MAGHGVEITTNFAELGAHYLEASVLLSEEVRLATEEIAGAMGEAYQRALVGETPVRNTGELARSTHYVVEPAREEIVVRFIQDAKSAPNQDGSGGGQEYARWVIEGRGPVDARIPGPYSTGKRALADGFGTFGPVVSAGPAMPNPYPERAMEQAQPELAGVMQAGTQAMLAKITP